MKWGEYSSDVHFILQRTALDATARNQQNNKTARATKTSVDPLHGFTPPLPSSPPSNVGAVAAVVSASPSKDLKKSLTFSGGGRTSSPVERTRLPLNVGVVRGVPKRLDNGDDHQHNNGRVDWSDKTSYTSPVQQVPAQPSHYQQDGQSIDQSPSNDGQLVYPRYDPPYGRVRLPMGSNGSSGDVQSGHHYSSPPPLNQQDSSPLNDSVRFPPPYRNPPPPFAGMLSLLLLVA